MEKWPNDINAEKHLLATFLSNQDLMFDHVDKLVPDDFFKDSHQTIWKIMCELLKAGQDLDAVTLRGEIGKRPAEANVVIDALAEVYQVEAEARNIQHLVAEIKNKSLLRQIVRTTYAYMQGSKLPDAKAGEILVNIEKDVLNISDKLLEQHPIDATGIITELEGERERIAKLGWKGINTKFTKLDEHTGGLIPTQVWIIGAYTGTAKTFFLLQMLLNILEQGAKAALFSLEMDRKWNMLRLLANLSGVGVLKIYKNQLLEEEARDVQMAQDTLKKYQKQLFIYDSVYTIDEIRLKTKKLKVKQGLNVMMLDYIQNVKGAESLYERMSAAAAGIYQLAHECSITALIASQVSQEAAGWQSKQSIDYKGAGEIAAVADVGLWIKKVESDKDARQIILRKVRHGIPGKFMTRLTFPSGRMLDLDRESPMETPVQTTIGADDSGSVKDQL